MRRWGVLATCTLHVPASVASRARFITGKSTFAAKREFFHSPERRWHGVTRTLTEPRAAALAEMVKADMFTCNATRA